MKTCYKISHRHIFLFGCGYYLFVPLVLGYFGAFDSIESLHIIARYFDGDGPAWPFLVLFCVLAPVMYLLSGFVIPRGKFRRYGVPLQSERRRGAWMLLPVYGAILAALIVQAKSMLFTGYSSVIDVSLQGQLATLQMLLLYQYLYERTTNRSTALPFGGLLLLNSIILLSLGGRLYVVSAAVAIYFRWWNWGAHSRAAQARSLALLICGAVALVWIGMWRVGDQNYSLVGFYVVAESLFTSISSFTLFSGDQWSNLAMPREFLASFANIIPNVLWPDKAEWFNSLTSHLRNFEMPFGAVNIVASAVSNFGYLGGLLFFLFVGLYMSAAARTHGRAAREAHYCYLVGLLPFVFFRDPFQVQVKLVMTGFLLYWITVLMRKKSVETLV